jgi:hypothetical protein
VYSGYMSGSGDLNQLLLTHYLLHQFSLRNRLMMNYSIKGENVRLVSCRLIDPTIKEWFSQYCRTSNDFD